jgi:hypothetical protein
MSQAQIAFTTPNPGPFTLPNPLGIVPGSVIFELTSGGAVYFQPGNPSTATTLNLIASDAGITGFAIVFSSATAPTVTSFGSNSTIRLQEIVDDAQTLGDVAPALATGGYSEKVALSIANDVMQSIINGGPGAQPYNWKWNRFNLPVFFANSLQQDYFIPGLNNLGWLESGWASNINQTSIPKNTFPIEIDKDLLVSNMQMGYIGKASWLPNSMLNTGQWGVAPQGPTAGNPSGQTTVPGPGLTGMQNPGPGVIYTNPVGQLVTPYNATTIITDPNGNPWCLTTFGTCGSTIPAFPSFPAFPTLRNPNIIATTVQDGTSVWTAINPKGQGIRLAPMPPQSGIVWAIQLVGQMLAPRFFSTQQLINPIPDNWEWAFKQGFFAQCYRRNPDSKVRAKFNQENQMWLEALDKSVKQGDREPDDFGFYPGNPMVMDTGWGFNMVTPSMPFGPWSGW